MENEEIEIDAKIISLKKSQHATTFDIQYQETTTLDDGILQPPFSPTSTDLYKIRYSSQPLSNSINTTAKNVCLYGWQVVKVDETDENEYGDEYDNAVHILNTVYPTPNALEKILKQIIEDALTYGYSADEVVFNLDKSKFQLYRIMPHEFRITKRDRESTTFINYDNGIEFEDTHKFRRYAQISGQNKIFFKDILDPRYYDFNTGEIIEVDSGNINSTANPVLYIDDFGILADNVYPYPIWLPTICDIKGNANASKLNSDWLSEGMLVPMMLLISGGQLTKSAYNKIKDIITNSKGIENAAKMLILEAKGSKGTTESLGDKSISTTSNVTMSIEKLPAMDKTDAQFLKYVDKTKKNIIETFGIPELFFGNTEIANYATAREVVKVTNEQVFQPYRNVLESKINQLLNIVGITHYKFKMNSPKTNDYENYDKILKPYIDSQIITPNYLIDRMNDTFNTQFDYLDNGDIPLRDWLKENSNIDEILNESIENEETKQD